MGWGSGLGCPGVLYWHLLQARMGGGDRDWWQGEIGVGGGVGGRVGR